MARNVTGPSAERERSLGRDPGAATPRDAGEGASTVLARIGAELVALHGAVLELQDTLGPVLSSAAGEACVSKAAQGLDLVAQTLDGLSTFVDALATEGGSSEPLDAISAAARVGIGALSSRLAGRAAPRSDGAGHGDVELF